MMNNQSPNPNHQINSNTQIPIPKHNRFAKLVIGAWLLLGYYCLVIGYSNAYALNLDKVKIYFLEGDYKGAIAEGERLIAKEPHSDELYYMLGLSYLKDGNYLRACDIFEIILREFKNSDFRDEAKIGLGDAYFLREDYVKAKDYYQELIDSKPQSKFKAQIYYRLGQIQAKLGSAQQAKEYTDRLKQEFPLNLELRANKDLCLFTDSDSVYYTVQVGVFLNFTNAKNLKERLLKKGYPAYIEEAAIGGKKSYRVRVGKTQARQEIVSLENKLSGEGYPVKICP